MQIDWKAHTVGLGMMTMVGEKVQIGEVDKSTRVAGSVASSSVAEAAMRLEGGGPKAYIVEQICTVGVEMKLSEQRCAESNGRASI